MPCWLSLELASSKIAWFILDLRCVSLLCILYSTFVTTMKEVHFPFSFFFKFLEICINNTDNEINNEDIAHYHSHKTTIVHLVHWFSKCSDASDVTISFLREKTFSFGRNLFGQFGVRRFQLVGVVVVHRGRRDGRLNGPLTFQCSGGRNRRSKSKTIRIGQPRSSVKCHPIVYLTHILFSINHPLLETSKT